MKWLPHLATVLLLASFVTNETHAQTSTKHEINATSYELLLSVPLGSRVVHKNVLR